MLFRSYYDDMKRRGLEPYNPSSIKKSEPKPYEPSEWSKEMHRDIVNRNGRPPGDRFIAELEKRGQTQKRYEEARRIADANK